MHIKTLLIANRGEIACRIMRTCRALGIRAVALYSDADADALHVQMADEALHIGPAPAVDSYLAVEKIIAAARRANADAVHPGFGFLAENAEFARACAAAGLVFIGPAPAAIDLMGNKHAARELAAAAGVPIIPGYGGADQSFGRFQQAAAQIGYPVMVKAAAGGGGKGMRLVNEPAALQEALAAAQRESQQAFGSVELLLEKALLAPRHVEIQVLGDQQGHIIHLGERECSIQRRHQKIIEETPVLPAKLRAEMGITAVTLARAVGPGGAGYTNAGTVEFLLDADDQFYFLEMNTRLQVEHPITEMVTGIDLVEWQIRIAAGEALPWRQADIQLRGHAIEARIYAENPARDFLPVSGDIVLWRLPAAEGVRVESGIKTHDTVTVHYDPMLAKIIAHGPDRKTAVRRLARALETAVLLGITTNLPFLIDVLRHPAFLEAQINTNFIPDHFAGWQAPAGDVFLALIAAALKQFEGHPQLSSSAGYWRNNPNQPLPYRFMLPNGEEALTVNVTPLREKRHFHVSLSTDADAAYAVQLHDCSGETVDLSLNGYRRRVTAVSRDDNWWIQTRAGMVVCQSLPLLPEPKPQADAGGSLRAPMPGAVLAVLVEVGQKVSAGDPLMKLEAMKMEHTIRTAAAGVVVAIYYAAGDTVEADALLVHIEAYPFKNEG